MPSPSVLDAIGNTPLVELHNVVPPRSARVLVKLEWANPTGSMKERLGPKATVVTLLVDSGFRYISTGLFTSDAVDGAHWQS